MIKILLLILISVIGFCFEKYFSNYFLFSLQLLKVESFKSSVSILPLLLILPVLISDTLKSTLKDISIVFSYLAIFLFLSPKILFAVFIVLSLICLFYLERMSREHFLGNLFSVTLFFLSCVPILLYSLDIKLSPLHLYLLILFKSCLIMRILSWLVDRRIYKRRNYQSVFEFLEFIFCPVFFIFPGQIQFFLFGYFHENKKKFSEHDNKYSVVLLALWGFALMVIYSYLDQIFWGNFDQISIYSMKYGRISTQLLIGFYWLVLIYFQQTAGMAYQISLARILGYNFKYDMHWPLLTRSPIEYLRKHSSYVKDYIVDMGLKPIALLLLRYGLNEKMTYPLAAILSYSFYISLQTGYRPDYERPWLVTFTMIFFLAIFILNPLVVAEIKHKLSISTEESETLLVGENKPFKEWRVKDYVLWIINLIILSIYKACLGFAKAFANRN